jgi:hypothetical protein
MSQIYEKPLGSTPSSNLGLTTFFALWRNFHVAKLTILGAARQELSTIFMISTKLSSGYWILLSKWYWEIFSGDTPVGIREIEKRIGGYGFEGEEYKCRVVARFGWEDRGLLKLRSHPPYSTMLSYMYRRNKQSSCKDNILNLSVTFVSFPDTWRYTNYRVRSKSRNPGFDSWS